MSQGDLHGISHGTNGIPWDIMGNPMRPGGINVIPWETPWDSPCDIMEPLSIHRTSHGSHGADQSI